MDITYVFAGLAVANRNEAAAWYERLLGRPPDFLPNDAEAAWQPDVCLGDARQTGARGGARTTMPSGRPPGPRSRPSRQPTSPAGSPTAAIRPDHHKPRQRTGYAGVRSSWQERYPHRAVKPCGAIDPWRAYAGGHARAISPSVRAAANSFYAAWPLLVGCRTQRAAELRSEAAFSMSAATAVGCDT